MAKINLDMTLKDVMMEMSDGVIGAITVLIDIAKKKGADAFLLFGHLDDMGIYGSDIWICFKDICKQDIDRLIEEIPKRRWLQGELQKIKHNGRPQNRNDHFRGYL